MKKALILFILLSAVLSSCSAVEPMDYFNSQFGCLLGETCYESLPGIEIQSWNPGWEGPYDGGLCRDPLCSHDSEDSLCPSSSNLWQKTLVTDGSKLYINALNPLLTDNSGTMYRQIFSMNQDGSAFTLLHTYDASGNSSPYMQYADGYLYFEQGFYHENYSPADSYTTSDEQFAHVMRIPVDGGKAETVLSDELDIGSSFYVDSENYYLLYPDDNGDLVVDIINIETGNVTQNAAAEVEGLPYYITVYAGKTWLVSRKEVSVSCPAEGGGTHFYTTGNLDLYEYTENGFVKVCDNKSGYTFGGGIWYSESDRLYLGAKEMPTGAPGGEKAPVDYYVTATKKVCRIDPEDYSITEYVPGGDFDPEDTIVIGFTTESGMLASVGNGRARFASDAEAYRCFIGFADRELKLEKVYS